MSVEMDLSARIRSMTSTAEFESLAKAIDDQRPDQVILLYSELFRRRGELQADQALGRVDIRVAVFLDSFMACSFDELLAFKSREGVEDAFEHWRAEPRETFEHFWLLAQSTDNPVIRAVLFSGLWEFRPLINHDKQTMFRPVEAARASIPSHIDAAAWFQARRELEPLTRTASVAQHWKTAIVIAGQIRAFQVVAPRIPELRKALEIALIDAPHWALTLVECELALAATKSARNADLVPDVRLVELLAMLDRIAEYLGTSMLIHLEHEALETRARIEFLMGKGPDHNERARRRALLLEDRITRTESGMLQSLYWKEAAAEYQQAGLRDDANRAKARAREALQAAEERGEFQSVRVPLGVTSEQIDDMVAPFFDGDVSARRILASIGTRLFVSSLERTTERATVRRRSIVSQIAITVPVIDDRTLAELGPDTAEQERYERRSALVSEINIHTVLISSILERLRVEHHLHWDDLYTTLAASDAVEPDDLPFLRAAAERYIARDTISTIHILVPRVEQLVRRMLRAAGAEVTALREGELRERPLGELLRDAVKDNVLPPGCVELLQALLSEDSGMNLRNRIAHGWLKPAECSQTIADRVLHTALYLAGLRMGAT